MDRTITTRIPEEILFEIKRIAQKENLDTSTIIRKLLSRAMNDWRKDYAIEQYRIGEFSFGQAAKFSGLNVMDFPGLLKQKKVPLNLDEEEFAEELKSIEKTEMMDIAVTNTSSMIFIAKLDLFYLIKNIFSKILVPKQVINEIFEKESPENSVIKRELNTFLEESEIKNMKDLPLHIGERSAISLCLEKNINNFLSDDKKARNYARNLGLNVMGIAGIIIKNLEKGKIKKQEAKQILNELIEKDYYISSDYYSRLMQEIENYR